MDDSPMTDSVLVARLKAERAEIEPKTNRKYAGTYFLGWAKGLDRAIEIAKALEGKGIAHA